MGARWLVLGLDGASWDVAAPWLEAGELPVLARLRREGAWARFRSTLPPVTFPAWSSILTGCTPGVHGIFDFAHRLPGTHRLELVNATHRRVPTVFRWLSDRGARVATLLVPSTWPPERLDGVVIAGFDSPAATTVSAAHCRPRRLLRELHRRHGPLHFAPFQENRIGPGWHEAALAALLRELERKVAVARDLLRREQWDAFMLVFGESDTVGHHFWMFADPASPRHRERPGLRDAIRRVYRALDRALGELLEVADAELVSVVSDHGMGGAGIHALSLNRFLEERGWLRFSRGRSPGALSGAREFFLRRVPPAAQQALLRHLPGRLLGALEAGGRWAEIDFTRTRAFSSELDYAPSIHLDLRGAERERAVAELREQLLAWEVDGRRPVRAVWTREQLYAGPWVERAPDLLVELELRGGYTYVLRPAREFPPGRDWRLLGPQEWVGGRGLGMNGTHRREGVLVLHGRGVRPGRLPGASVEDLVPTALALLGEEIPAYVDGRVLRAALARPGPARYADWEGELPAPRAYSPAQARLVEGRLRDLGYL